jgi:cell cycle arrest protein BUB3
MINFDSDVSSLSVCGMYISVAVARNVYFYDMRNLTGPVKAKFSPLEYHIRCLQSSSEWNGTPFFLKFIMNFHTSDYC